MGIGGSTIVTHEYLVFSGIEHVLTWLFTAALAGGLIALFATAIRDMGHRHHHHA